MKVAMIVDRRVILFLSVTLLMMVAFTSAQVSAQEKEWCGEIRSNTTWGAGTVHRVCTGGVRVQRSVLTIAPAADILMDDGASLIIESGSKLSAVGAQDAGIRFRANTRNEAPGFWGQILFEEGAEPSDLVFAEIRHGGKDGLAMIEVQSGTVVLNGLLLHGAGDVPMAFRANSMGPSLDAAGNVTQGGACQNIVIRSNNVDGIRVLAGAAVDVADSQTWHNFCAPYLINDEIVIAGTENPELRLGVGAQLQFGGDGAFVAGVDAENPGQLLSDGTPSEPVSLTSFDDTPGSWVGIDLTEYSGFSSLNNTIVEHGGKGDRPMVTVRSTQATTIGSGFHNALGYPLALLPESVGPFLSAVFLEGEDVSTVFVGNGVQRVLVLSSESSVLEEGALWGNAGVPMELDGDLTLAGSSIPKLLVDAGCTLAFRPGKTFQIGDKDLGPADLDVLGDEAHPVVFTGTTKEPGAWAGMVVDETATTVRIDHAVFEYAGSASTPMLEWHRVEGDIARSVFRGAVTYPISIPVSVAADVILDPDVSNPEGSDDLRSVFEDNGVNRVLITTDRTVRGTSTRWNDPGAPVEVDGVVGVSSPSTAVLSLTPGLSMLFRPDSGLRLGDGDRGRGSLSISAADDATVTLGAVDADAGWLGVSVLKGSSADAGGSLVVGGIAPTAAAFTIEDGGLVLTEVDLTGSKRGTGVIVTGSGTATIKDSTIKDFGVGLNTKEGGSMHVSRSIVHGHSEWAFLNETADGPCTTAELVYWGSPNGPKDESDAIDGCVNNSNESPSGDKVSDFVNWWPYAVDTSFKPSSGLGPNPHKAYLPTLMKGQ